MEPHVEFVGTDRLPEDTPYRDTGCRLFQACLTCPLPACRHDIGSRAADALAKAYVLRLLLRRGLSVDEAANVLGVSRRTVFRLKALQRAV